jgi:hypothetical protein
MMQARLRTSACGEGALPKTFLLREMAARGKKLD